MRYVIKLEGFISRKHASSIAKALHRLWPEIQVTATALPNKRRKPWKQQHAAVDPITPVKVKRTKKPKPPKHEVIDADLEPARKFLDAINGKTKRPKKSVVDKITADAGKMLGV